MADGVGPDAVCAAAEVGVDAVRAVACPSEASGSRERWADAVGSLQRLIDVASSAQDAALARLAAIELEVGEDGVMRERQRALGHVALDAPAIVSSVLNVSSVHAERRVRAAVQLAGDGTGASCASGLAGLHAAMGEGRLDSYRASVVAGELEDAPTEVAAGVVASLEPFFEREDAPRLRRRCRRLLARVSPDLLRQRATRARAESGLRRWVDEPGVDRWEGTFPSEAAARAWAAIDALAQRYVREGGCARIEQARAKALTDLVEGSATIETVVTLTVPAELLSSAPAPERSPRSGDHPADLVEVGGLHPGGPTLVERGWIERVVADTRTAGRDLRGRVRVRACDRTTGAELDQTDELSTDVYRPGRRLRALVRQRDGRCRFPGCHVSARFCDLDHVRPWPAGPTAGGNLLCLCRRHHRVKQRPGWNVALHADGTSTWTDPTGRTRVTHPVDALHGVVLSAPPRGPGVHPLVRPAGRARTIVPDGPHTALEFALEHHAGGPWRPPPASVVILDLTARRITLPPFTSCRRRRAPARSSTTDPPPF